MGEDDDEDEDDAEMEKNVKNDSET